MRRILLTVAVALAAVQAQPFDWDSTVRLTYSDSSTHNSMTPARSIATGPSGCIHVVFYDYRTGHDQIYYKRSADSGATWSSDTMLSNNSGLKGEPAVAASAGYVHAVWEDRDSGYNAAICYRRSSDAGLTWLPQSLLAPPGYNCRNPSVAAQDSFVHVAWADDSAGRELYYRRSTDFGATWSDKVKLTNDMQESWHPSLGLHDSFVHLAWRDWRDHSFEIYYKRSTDYGATWSMDARLSGDVATGSYNPCLAADSGLVHVVWWDTRTEPFEIYYKNSTDDGGTWNDEQRLTNDTTGSYNMTVAARGSTVHVMWEALYGTSFIMYKFSTDAGATWSLDTALTTTPDYWSVSPCAAMDAGDVHVIWTDFRDSEYGEIYYKRKLAGSSGAEESRKPQATSYKLEPTIIHGVLLLGGENGDCPQNRGLSLRRAICDSQGLSPGFASEGLSPVFAKPALLDISGQKVLALHPGANDVSNLAPGIYFVRSEPLAVSREPSAVTVRKVVLTR